MPMVEQAEQMPTLADGLSQIDLWFSYLDNFCVNYHVLFLVSMFVNVWGRLETSVWSSPPGKGSPWKYFNGVACRCNYEIVLINMLHVHRFHELWKDMTFVITF